MTLKCFDAKFSVQRMGVDLSQALEYDGMKILEVARDALTDSNFHPEAKILNEMLRFIENDIQDFELIADTVAPSGRLWAEK